MAPAQVFDDGPAQEAPILRFHRGRNIVSGYSWRVFRKTHPSVTFEEFWNHCCLYYEVYSESLREFFLLRENTPRFPSALMIEPKVEPIDNLEIDNSEKFCYICDVPPSGLGLRRRHHRGSMIELFTEMQLS